jgi:putative ABC transport system permease protein
MWSNYALALYRTLTRHKLYAALNTLGLALGIAVCATLLLVVRFEASFDRWIPQADHIVRFNKINTFPGRPTTEYSSTQAVLLPALLPDFPQIAAGARIWTQTVVVRTGAQTAFEEVALADPSVFDVFRLPFVAGDPRTALPDLNSLVVSQEMARKYFGTERAIGRALTVVMDGQPRTYRVTGVLKDVPPNSHLKLGMIGRFSPDLAPGKREMMGRWGSSFLYTYLRLRAPGDIATLQAAMPAFIDRHAHDADGGSYTRKQYHYRLVPLTDIHFADSKTGAAFKAGADPLFVVALGVMGVVTLLIAIVNYISLATARAGMRAREVAVRKVMGATRRALIVQFVAESVALAVAAGLIAMALVELSLPGVSAMLGEPIRLIYLGADGVLLPLVGFCLGVGLLSGAYPAFVLSGFQSAAVLASARTPGGGRTGARVREVLAVGQFAVAIALMICTAIVFAQIQFVRNADRGFRRDGLILVKGIGEPAAVSHMHALVQAFGVAPGVISATASDRRPATDSENSGNIVLISNPKVEPTITAERIGPDYLKTYGLTVVAGRGFDQSHGLDDRAGLNGDQLALRGGNLMINESAALALSFTDPKKAIGQRIRIGRSTNGSQVVMTIVGVVRDVRFQSPRDRPPPQYYIQNSALPATMDQPGEMAAAVRANEADIPAVTQRLESIWRSMVPGVPFRSETVAAALKPYYDSDARRGQLFAAGSALSAAIACLGLYGLAAFNTSRRTKEIGIRKTLGASTADVLRLLIGEFLRPVLWANLIAWPVAWFVMRSWLAGFDQRIELGAAYFLAPTAAAVVVAVATVADQAIRVARAEPARALRYE